MTDEVVNRMKWKRRNFANDFKGSAAGLVLEDLTRINAAVRRRGLTLAPLGNWWAWSNHTSGLRAL